MGKIAVTNKAIARAIVHVLERETISLDDLKRRAPRGFWDKVLLAMGKRPPDKAAVVSRWTSKSERREIIALLESLLSPPAKEPPATSAVRKVSRKPKAMETYPIEGRGTPGYEESVEVDTSMLVNLDVHDLISMGVVTEAVDNLDDSANLETSDSLDLYARDGITLMDTIDIAPETWPRQSLSEVAGEAVLVAQKLEERLRERLDKMVGDMESRLTALVCSAVQTAVQGAWEQPHAGDQRELRVRIDRDVFDLFQAECSAAFDNNASAAISAILMDRYGKLGPSARGLERIRRKKTTRAKPSRPPR